MIFRAKRHSVVLLFTDLTASTRFASSLEPEQYGEVLEQLRFRLEAVIERHGGEIIRIDGDGALCLFGYPVAYEDAGRRAVEAALEAHEAVENLDVTLPAGKSVPKLHSGIHAGVVLLRQGDIVRGRYEVLGDATNVAARICDAAKPGEVLVTMETIGRHRHLFDAGQPRMIEVAGHSTAIESLPVRRLTPTASHEADARNGSGPQLIGRKQEIDRIRDWRSSQAAAPFLMLHGPPGIGKSRLLSEVTREARGTGWRVARGDSDGYLGARPLQPFLQLAQALGATRIRSDDLGGADIREAIAIARAQSPVLLVLDDWQWSDAQSQSLLVSLIEQFETTADLNAVKLIVASREPWSIAEQMQPSISIALHPFVGGDLTQAISALLPGCDKLTASAIQKASGGTPLLLEEVCRAISAGRMVDTGSVQSAWYDLAVQARVEALPPDDAELLRLCSVIGPTVSTWLLAAASGSALDHAQLARLKDADFLTMAPTEEALQFNHGMTREAVYSGVGLNQRKDAHRTLAEILRSCAPDRVPGRDEALSFHLLASDQFEDALPASLEAADRALTLGALDRAQFHYRQGFKALQNIAPGSRQIAALRHIIKSFGRAAVVDPMPSHVRFFDHLLDYAKTVGDAQSIALATYWIGSHHYGLGEPRRSLVWLKDAYDQATALGANTFAIQIEANLGQSSAIAARYQDALRYMDTAIEAKLQTREPDQASTSLAYCLSSRGLVKADMGEFESAYEDFDASVEVLGDMSNPILPSLETQRCLALIYQGRFDEAACRADSSQAMSEHNHARFLIFSSQVLANYARFCATREKHYFHRFVEATLRLASSGRMQRISYKFAWIAEEMVACGATDQARLFAILALKRTLKGDRLGEAIAARALARLSAASGDKQSTLRYLAMAQRAAAIRLSKREAALNELCAADCHEALGDTARAQSHSDNAFDSFEQLGMAHLAIPRPQRNFQTI